MNIVIWIQNHSEDNILQISGAAPISFHSFYSQMHWKKHRGKLSLKFCQILWWLGSWYTVPGIVMCVCVVSLYELGLVWSVDASCHVTSNQYLAHASLWVTLNCIHKNREKIYKILIDWVWLSFMSSHQYLVSWCWCHVCSVMIQCVLSKWTIAQTVNHNHYSHHNLMPTQIKQSFCFYSQFFLSFLHQLSAFYLN